MIAIGTFTRSSSFRVGALITLLSGAAMAFIIYLWSVTNKDILIDEARNAALSQLWAYEALYERGGRQAVIGLVEQNLDNDLINWVAITDNDGQFLAGNSRPLGKLALDDDADIVKIDTPLTAKDAPGWGNKAVLVRRQTINEGVTVTVARDIDELYSAQALSRSLSWVFIAILGLISGLSLGVALYVVNRINRMSATADSIMQTGNLNERLAIDSNWDDLSKLAMVLNKMLDKIEYSVQNIKSVTDNVAHDLRTPLSRLRSRLDDLPDSSSKQQALAETDVLLGMFNGLLRIADIESKRQRMGFAEVSLGDIVRDVVDLYEPYIEEKHMSLTFDIQPATLRGDRNLLFQAFANLIDNAVKYAGENAQIRVTAKETSTSYIVSVDDSGPGVDVSNFKQLDRRFYRAQESRTSKGNGLGLSMVKAVADLHNAHIYYIPDPLLEGSGLGITLMFKKSSKALG